MDNSDRVLDWFPGHDPRNLDYPHRAVLKAGPATIRPKIHRVPNGRIDQRNTGGCVSFGSTNIMRTYPRVLAGFETVDNLEWLALRQYGVFQRRDEWRDAIQNIGFGTSTNAGASTLKAAGAYDEYRWIFGIEDLVDTVRTHARDGGSAVGVGTKWLDGMFDCPPGTLVDVSGSDVGGHFYVINGYHPSLRLPLEGWTARYEALLITNSWGETAWGKRGQAWIKVEDMAGLLADRGEGVVFIGGHQMGFQQLDDAERALPSIEGQY